MKAKILFLYCTISLSVFSQRVTLSVYQNYIPKITQKGDTLISSIPTGNQWIMDGVLLPGETQRKLVMPQSGEFTVLSTDEKTGCTSASEPLKALHTDVPAVRNSEFCCRVFPNPSNGVFKVSIESEEYLTLRLRLLSVDGKTVSEQKTIHTPGKQILQFGKSTLSAGVYTLLIHSGSKTITQKVVVE